MTYQRACFDTRSDCHFQTIPVGNYQIGRLRISFCVRRPNPDCCNFSEPVDEMDKYRLHSILNFSDILMQTIFWIVLVIVTFGLALPFFAYYFIRLIIDTTEIHQIA